MVSVLLLACNTPTPYPDGKPDTKPTQVNFAKADTTIVYECNERLFARSNAFAAVQAYLPVLQDMHVNVLWLMPIHPRGTVNSVNSPYCVKDYYDIDPAFGDLSDLKTLVQDAHSRGMKVILDWVANHTAYDNPLYINHPEYYTQPVGEERNWSDVVPLNYDLSEVREYTTNAMLYWVREADIDGFRCDYAEGCTSEFWSQAIGAIRAEKADAIMLAEASNTALYNAGFDWLYSWKFLGAVQNLFKGSKTLKSLYSTSANEFRTTPDGKNRLRYTTTHDASSENAPATFYRSAYGQLAAACLTFFLGGVPMIYSSQEIGDMSQINFFEYNIKNFSTANSIRNAYAALLNAYVNTAEARYGTRTDYSTDKVAMFTLEQKDTESGQSRSLLVVVNTTNTQQEVTLPMDWQRNKYLDPIAGDSIWSPKSLTLPAYGYNLYSN